MNTHQGRRRDKAFQEVLIAQEVLIVECNSAVPNYQHQLTKTFSE